MSDDADDLSGRVRVWRRAGIGVGVLALAAGAVWIDAATWDRDTVAAVGVCQDAGTGLRVPDQQCATGRPGDRWVYYRPGTSAPAVGGSTAGGSAIAPSGSGTVARGGETEGGGEVSDEGPTGSSGSSSGSGSQGGEEGGSSGGSSSGGSSGSGGGGGGGGGGGE